MEKAFLEGMNNINWRLKKDREKYWEMFKHKNKVDQDVKTRIDEKYIKGSWDYDWFRKILFDGDIGDIHYAPVPRHKQAERKKREEDEKRSTSVCNEQNENKIRAWENQTTMLRMF